MVATSEDPLDMPESERKERVDRLTAVFYALVPSACQCDLQYGQVCYAHYTTPSADLGELWEQVSKLGRMAAPDY